jgi:predicted dehydrogenase
MVRDGLLGDDLHVTTWFQFYLPPENSQNIRLLPDLTGGCLWDVGVYPNSMAITMIDQGVPAQVWARQVTGETGVDVGMTAQMLWPSGAVAQTSASFRTPFREGTHIVGNRGTLQLIEPWKPGVSGKDSLMVFTDVNRKEETIVTPAVDPYLCEVQAMEACILDGAAPVVTLEHSRNFLRTVLATYRSGASGKPEAVDTAAVS